MKLFTLLFCAAACAVESIPVVDMQDYFNPEKRPEFVAKMSRAMQEVGFFAVVNTGVDVDVIDRAYDQAQAFFALDEKTKMQYDGAHCSRQRGYQPIGAEVAKGKTIGDNKEFLQFGRENGPYENIWPNEVDLKQPMSKLYGDLESYLHHLENAIAEAIGIESEILHDVTCDGDTSLRVLHYPMKAHDGVWASAHTDIDFMTILPRATDAGLEVQKEDGTWIRVDVPDDAFIINVGDMLENLSNGFFRSAVHRVVSTDKNRNDRYSMVLFIHPKNETRLDPLPECIEMTGGVQKYPNANRWELLAERLADLGYATPEWLEKLSESGLIEQRIALGTESYDAMAQLRDHGFASRTVLSRLDELEHVN